MNNVGDLVGGSGTLGATRGFMRHKGNFKEISPPGNYVYIYATGINSFGKIVGWTDANAFVYYRRKFRTIAFPGADQTEAWGVNDSNVIVGWYITGPYAYGFWLVKGRYVSFGYPEAKLTIPYGINSSGKVSGTYTLDYETYHGFVTSPITAHVNHSQMRNN